MELRDEQRRDPVVGTYTEQQWLATADLVAGAFRKLPAAAFAATVVSDEDGDTDAIDADAA